MRRGSCPGVGVARSPTGPLHLRFEPPLHGAAGERLARNPLPRATRGASAAFPFLIQIPFDPNVHLGPITLAWHGIFTAVGIFFGVWLPLRLLRGKISEEDGWAVATWGVVGGIIGARLVHVIDQWQYYVANPLQIFFIWTGGIAIWGAAIGGVLGGDIAAGRRGGPVRDGGDPAAPGIPPRFALGPVGDTINGEH